MAHGPALKLAVALDGLKRRPAGPAVAEPSLSGPLIWSFCCDPAAGLAYDALSSRLGETRPGVTLGLSAPVEVAPAGSVLMPPPPRDGEGARRWFDRWRPEAVLLFGEVFQPAILAAADDRGIPVLGVALHVPRHRMVRWPFRGLARAMLATCSALLCEDVRAAATLRTLGAPRERLAVAGLLTPPVQILPSNEAERESVAELTSTRPVWCAAALPRSELAAVIEAHALALQRSHRLLLVIVPAEIGEAREIYDELGRQGWTVGLRSEGEDPEDDITIYIADLPGELGLWLRLAAIAFLGGTLSRNEPGRSPIEAAALGSAILHGPETGAYAADYRRLDGAGAARQVTKPIEIAAAVETLIAPDQAAEMAHAAWEVSTAGEDALSRTIAALDTALAGRG